MRYKFDASVEIEDMVRSIVTEVEGVTLPKVYRTEEIARTGHHRLGLDLHVSAWSPTLHGRQRIWHIDAWDAPHGDDPPFTELKGTAFAERVRWRFSDQLRNQRELADVARAHGIDHPYGLPDVAAYRYTLGHLHVASAALDLLVRRLGPRSALDDLAARIARLNVHGAGDEFHLVRLDGDIALIAGNVPVVQLKERLSADRVTLRGGIITVREPIPATILETLPGRTLRAVVETGIDQLDEAVVTATDINAINGATIITLDLPTARVCDHPVLGPVLAGLGATTMPPAVFGVGRP